MTLLPSLPLSLPLLGLIALAETSPPLSGLANLGVAGAVLVWTLVRQEPRLDRIERALERLARAQLLTLVARPDVDEPVKDQARTELRELDRAAGREVAS